MGTPPFSFFHCFTKGDNCFDFLFSFLDNVTRQKKSFKNEKLLPLKVHLFALNLNKLSLQ